jgi:hypothetical protein
LITNGKRTDQKQNSLAVQAQKEKGRKDNRQRRTKNRVIKATD